ncbi:MAG: hypothetical protein WA063_00610 [Minisyncoccia bacterium]
MPTEKNKICLIAFLSATLGISADYLLIQKTSGISFFIFNLAIVFSTFIVYPLSRQQYLLN